MELFEQPDKVLLKFHFLFFFHPSSTSEKIADFRAPYIPMGID